MRQSIASVAAALLATATAAADVRLSPEDGASHSYPTVCRQPGGFVAAWESDGTDGREVTVQRLDDDGDPTGAAFRANQENAGDQQLPDIACRSDGSFLLVWESRGQDGDGLGVFARDFAADGMPNGDELQVNTFSNDNQRRPRVCVDGSGRGMVVWSSSGQDGDGSSIYARRLAADATAEGGEFVINEPTTSQQSDADVACATDGERLVAWTKQRREGSDVMVRRVLPNGELDAGQQSAAEVDDFPARHAAVAARDDEEFVVVFDRDDAHLVMTTFRFSSLAGGARTHRPLRFDRRDEAPVVAIGPNDRTIVAWSNGADFDFHVMGWVRHGNSGTERTTAINADGGGNAGAVSPFGGGIDIATAADGHLVVWQKRDVFAEDSTSAIYARRFRDCIGDCSDDGVVAINELITGVRIALNETTVDACSRFDANASGAVEINELIRAVNEALARICPAPIN